MTVGYDYYALRPLYINAGTNSILAFSPGQLVPDLTVTNQGWVVGTDVAAVGDAPPTPQLFQILADTDGNPYMKAV